VTFCLVLCLAQNLLANKKPPVHPVNLNTASSAELQLVPGIGPSTADKILQMRKSHGAYKSVDESPRHQRPPAKTAGQNAQVPDRRQNPAH
jgi:DNA uptake protein ComE-like DNA-binding protein